MRGSNSGGDEILRKRPERPRGPPSLLDNGYRASFPRIKQSVGVVDNTPPSSTDVKERVEIYLYFSSGSSWPVLEWPGL